MKVLVGFIGLCTVAMAWSPSLRPRRWRDECVSGNCGTPNPIGRWLRLRLRLQHLVAMTDRGDTYQFADDQDGDGIEDSLRQLPVHFQLRQVDSDGDRVGDACDNCAGAANQTQSDVDGTASATPATPTPTVTAMPNGSRQLRVACPTRRRPTTTATPRATSATPTTTTTASRTPRIRAASWPAPRPAALR